MSTATNDHPSNSGDHSDEFGRLIEGFGKSLLDEQLSQAASTWMAMVTHAGAIRKHAIKQGFGMRASRRLALAFIAKCLGGEV